MISIILIPVLYFIYSPLLIAGIILAIATSILASKAEKQINHSFIKANHMKIPKLDSIIACIVLIITLAGGIMRISGGSIPHKNIGMEIKMNLDNIGSCLTGRRSILFSPAMKFGSADIPEDMPKPEHKPELSFDDLPLEAIFSMMMSSVNTILIMTVPIGGGISLIIYYKRRHKFDNMMNELVQDEFRQFSDEELEKLFTFGLIPNDASALDNTSN